MTNEITTTVHLVTVVIGNGTNKARCLDSDANKDASLKAKARTKHHTSRLRIRGHIGTNFTIKPAPQH